MSKNNKIDFKNYVVKKSTIHTYRMTKIECFRPHCAIRSHYHELLKPLTFAEKLGYLPKFCDVANKYFLNNEKLFEDYDFLIKPECLLEEKKCVNIIFNMLRLVNKEKNEELKKLRILYLFTMVSTPFWIYTTYVNKSHRLLYSIKDAYHRMLKCDDVEFVDQILFCKEYFNDTSLYS